MGVWLMGGVRPMQPSEPELNCTILTDEPEGVRGDPGVQEPERPPSPPEQTGDWTGDSSLSIVE